MIALIIRGLLTLGGLAIVAVVLYQHFSGRTAAFVERVEHGYGLRSDAARAARRYGARQRRVAGGWILLGSGGCIGIVAALARFPDWLFWIGVGITASGAVVAVIAYALYAMAFQDLEMVLGSENLQRLRRP